MCEVGFKYGNNTALLKVNFSEFRHHQYDFNARRGQGKTASRSWKVEFLLSFNPHEVIGSHNLYHLVSAKNVANHQETSPPWLVVSQWLNLIRWIESYRISVSTRGFKDCFRVVSGMSWDDENDKSYEKIPYLHIFCYDLAKRSGETLFPRLSILRSKIQARYGVGGCPFVITPDSIWKVSGRISKNRDPSPNL